MAWRAVPTLTANMVAKPMNEAGDDDSIIPDEWVTLANLPRLVGLIYGVRSGAITRELILAVRSKHQIQHRIPCKPRDRTRSPSLPPGLEQESRAAVLRVFVTDWETADPDWKSLTVGGWKQDDGTRERL